MEITFKDRKLEKIVDNPRKLRRHFNQAAENIERRLETLNDVENLSHVSTKPPIRRHLLTGDFKGCYAVDVTGQLRIVFEIDHDLIPRLADNSVDLEHVTKICIIGIYDYH